MIASSPATRWTDRLELGEGGRWAGGRLLLTNILQGELFEDDRASERLHRILKLDVPLGAVAPIEGFDDVWIAAAGDGIALLHASGRLHWLDRVESANATPARMNDGTADPAGRFWAGSMAYDNTPGAGSLYRVGTDGSVTRALDGFTITNGPAFSADGRTMYIVDSARGLVDRYDVNSEGSLDNAFSFLRLADGRGAPDGLTVDAQGNVWIALWGGSCVNRYRPDATLDLSIELPAEQPTSVCLGGADGRTLFITSAHLGLTGEVDSNSHHGALFEVAVDVPGIPAFTFKPDAALRLRVIEFRNG